LKRGRHDKMLKERDHYKTTPKSTTQQILLTFSVARNWYRLNQEPSGKIGRELRFLDCFKFFAMFMVIFAHTNWVIYESAISNPQDPERLLHTAAGTLLVSGSLITVTFFVISGLLLTINWLDVSRALQAKKETWSFGQYAQLFVKFNAFRYIRLTVPYAFVLLMSGVYFENAGGPLWRHIFEREQLACRRNWWTNLLYINNFVRTDERVSSGSSNGLVHSYYNLYFHPVVPAPRLVLGSGYAFLCAQPGATDAGTPVRQMEQTALCNHSSFLCGCSSGAHLCHGLLSHLCAHSTVSYQARGD